MSKEILDQIRQGVNDDMKAALTDTSLTRLDMHAVTQSYLLLTLLDKIDMIDTLLTYICEHIVKLEAEK